MMSASPTGPATLSMLAWPEAPMPTVLGYNALTRSNKSVINTLNRFARQLHAYFLTGSPVTKEAANVMPLRSRKGA